MERAREEQGDAGVADGSECGRKDVFELPFSLGCNATMESTANYGAEWPLSAPNFNSVDGVENQNCVTGTACGISPIDTCSVVEELTIKNCGISKAAAVRSLDAGQGVQGLQSQKGHWQHLYKLTDRSRSQLGDMVSSGQGHIVLNARDELRRTMSTDYQDLKLSSSQRLQKDPDEAAAQLMNGYNKIMFSSSFHMEDWRQKTLSSPHLAQSFAAKVMKGKGVVGEQYLRAKSFVPGAVYQDGALTSGIKQSSNVSSIMENDNLLHNFESSAPQFPKKHVILRNWLKPGRYKSNKVESIDIFKKILELVDAVHSQGFTLQKLRPSYLVLEFPNKVKYTGPLLQKSDRNHSFPQKRSFSQEWPLCSCSNTKQQMFVVEPSSYRSRCSCGIRSESEAALDGNVSHSEKILDGNSMQFIQNTSGDPGKITSIQQFSSVSISMEEQWYASAEELNGMGCTSSSNTYSLGVLFFELLCCSKTPKLHAIAMMNLRNRVLPPSVLSEHPQEAGFCLWLLHPDASLHPSVREILESDFFCQSQKLKALEAAKFQENDNVTLFTEVEDAESELLHHFLVSLREKKESIASKLKKKLEFLDADMKVILSRTSKNQKDSCTLQSEGLCLLSRSSTVSNAKSLMKGSQQFEEAYFSIRSDMQKTEVITSERPDKDVLNSVQRLSRQRLVNEDTCMNKGPKDLVEVFFEGLCKYAAYNKLEECGKLRNGDLLNSANVVCSLGFDRDEEFIATAWVSKKIKIFGFDALMDDSVDVHYPTVEMSNESMLSCVCWNSYIQNYLASTDYNGIVQIWDASTSQVFSHHSEHQKRAWSVDFSKVDPRKFATGSDDYFVKLWSINERSSSITIQSPANVCCVQFSPSSSNLLAFGSADYKLYCYDLRHTRIPWCTLAEHNRTVSHVRFLDTDTIVSASTDNTLKLWDLKKTSPTGISSHACSLTYKGHSNQKNFVGLSVLNGYLACGSETNEVFTYHKSLPMPITSYKFGSVDSISGRQMDDDNSQFVSSVCWRKKSNMILAANSSGNIRLLRMTRETV